MTIAKFFTGAFWGLPTAWLLLHKLAWYAELACDDCVVNFQGNRVGYAQHLLLMSKKAKAVAGTISLIEVSNHYQRIAAVLDGARVRRAEPSLHYIYAFLLLVLMILGCCLKLTVKPQESNFPVKLLPLVAVAQGIDSEAKDSGQSTSLPGLETLRIPYLAVTNIDQPQINLRKPQLETVANFDIDPVELNPFEPFVELSPSLVADLKLRKSVVPRYPSSARRKQKEGEVLVVFDVLADGTVDNIRLLQSAHFLALDQAAINAVKQYQYYPPTYQGESTAVGNVTEIFRFELHGDAN